MTQQNPSDASIPTRIWSQIDYDRDGKQADWLRLPISSDLSAYGWVPIPVVSIKNGQGPTAILIAGSHGDEYEGQIALRDLIRKIEPADVKGRIIILPALNAPAVEAGRRVSPLDGGNLNRLYPGHPHGTPTQMIAHYMVQVILPMADVVVDIHSGGRSLDYIPCTLISHCSDPARNRLLDELVREFGAPVNFLHDGKGGGGSTTLPANAERLGVPVLTTELGGGATLQKFGTDLAGAGVRRVLRHLGIWIDRHTEPASPTRMMVIPGRECYLYADTNGLFEPAAAVGEDVKEGQHAGYLHFIDQPMRPPIELTFPTSGMVASRRFPTLTLRGDCLYELMKDISEVA